MIGLKIMFLKNNKKVRNRFIRNAEKKLNTNTPINLMYLRCEKY